MAALYKASAPKPRSARAGWCWRFLCALTCGSGLGVGQRLLAGLVAPLVPFLYALGQMLGWFRLGVAAPGATAEITVVDETGKVLADTAK